MVLTWLVYALTGSAAWSALIFGVNKVPTVLITPFAGVWVEGKNKKHIMVWTDLARAVCVAFIATEYLLGRLSPWMLFVTTLLISTVEAFRVPAGTAITPRILEDRYYEYGISLESSITGVTEIIGTAAAGGMIALLGISGAIYVDMATFVLSAGMIAAIDSREEKTEKQAFDAGEYGKSLLDGLRYVKESKVFLFFVSVCILLNALITPFNSLMAPLSGEVLKADASMLSVISVSATVGMILGSVVYPWIRQRVSQRVIFVLPGIGIGLYYIGLIACMPLYENPVFTYGYVAATTGMLGCFVVWMNTFISVEFIRKVDENYLARCSGIMTAANVASTPIASFVISAVIGFVGTANIFLGVGIFSVIVCMLLVRRPELQEDEKMCAVQGEV